jgi:ParB-like chromosome segregation protein Spo0J
MSTETKNETAGVAAPAAPETQNPTVEVKAEKSTSTVTETDAEGKLAAPSPGVGEQQAMKGQVRTVSENVVYLPVNELKPHQLNEKIYGHDLEQTFVEAIGKNGIYQPILITADKRIIAGHRRHAAAKQVGLLTVPTVMFYSEDELEIKAALIEANKQRVKTNEQIGREFKVLDEIEKERAKLRMATNKEGQGVQPVAQAEKGKARDLAAKKIGEISGFSAERAGAVAEVIDKLAANERTKKKADELRVLLNKNINAAYTRAVNDNHIKKATKAKKASKKVGVGVAPSAGDSPVVIEGYDDAFHALCDAETFITGRASTKMSQRQKTDWQRSVQRIVKFLVKMGVEIVTK